MYHNYTDEEKENIIKWIKSSIQRLIERDPDLLLPDRIQTEFKIEGYKELNREVHETTINHRLARYIEDTINDYGYADYHVNIEYNRYFNNLKMVRSIKTGEYIEVRPDIIVHKRTRLKELLPHLLVVEAKKYSNNDKDENNVRNIMNDERYSYKFGLLVSYYENETTINCELLTFENGEFITRKFEVEK